MALRLALLRSDGPHHRYLERQLAAYFDLACSIVEPGREQIRRLRRRGKWIDWFWWNYHALRRSILGLDRYRKKFFAEEEASPVQATPVETINDRLVVKELQECQPDLTIVIGTSILSDNVLDAAGPGIINIHGGMLPWYRGNHCFFFALYDGRPDRAGSTLHFVDRGVDTGDVIEVVFANPKRGENAERLYCRAELAAIARLVALLKEYESGTPLPRQTQSGPGKTFRMRDRKPHHDIGLWIRTTFRRTGAPSEAVRESKLENAKEVCSDGRST